MDDDSKNALGRKKTDWHLQDELSRREFVRGLVQSGALAYSAPWVAPAITAGLAAKTESAEARSAIVKPLRSLWVTGDNTYGGLGIGSTTTQYTLVNLPGWWQSVSGSSYNSVMFIRKDGTAWVVGDNAYGVLGLGNTTSQSSPVQLPGNWSFVASSFTAGLYLRTDSTLWVCGFNSTGQLGQGTTTNVSSPVQLAGSWAQVAGGNQHSMGIHTDGTLWTWGYNKDGELGIGTSGNGTNTSSPVQVAGSWIQCAATDYASFGIKTDGTLWAWGWGDVGELANGASGNTAKVSLPTQIAGSWTQISAQPYGNTANGWAVAQRTDGTWWAWGHNGYGQLAQGNITDYSSPVQIAGSWTWIRAGGKSCIGRKADGSIWNWGGGSTLADGNINQSSPIQVPGTNFTNECAVLGFAQYFFRW